VHPDVRLKRLPFYDLECELLKPSTLSKFPYILYFETASKLSIVRNKLSACKTLGCTKSGHSGHNFFLISGQA
jgi:hypothetical protein